VLVLSEYYLPAYRAGGPVRSLSNLVERLGEELEFRVVTGDRDLGDPRPYAGVELGRWTPRGRAACLYVPRKRRPLALRRVLRATPHDVLYLNSLFSPGFGIAPLVLRRLRVIPPVPVVLAPRGELSAGALSLKAPKKRAFLRVARALRLHAGVRWQGSTELEAAEIRAWAGPGAVVEVAGDLAAGPGAPAGDGSLEPKRPGRLRLLFYSRVSPKKNLLRALELLDGLPGEVSLDVHGPIEDRAYWRRCEEKIAGLASNVTVRAHGPVEHESVTAALSGYDAFLLPTLGENFGHAVVEALGAGCPAVISDTTPWRGLERHRAGWDLPLGDAAPWRAVLERLVGMDAEEHAEWSRGARDLAAQRTADPAVVGANRALFTRAATAPGRARP